MEGVSPEEAAEALFGERSLGAERLEALDRLGNANGRYDLGDLLAWTERCREGRARCGAAPKAPPPSPGGAARTGLLIGVTGPGIEDARAPGLEFYESAAGSGPRRFVLAGAIRTGAVLQFRVPGRRKAHLYTVRVLAAAGADHALLEPRDHRAEVVH